MLLGRLGVLLTADAAAFKKGMENASQSLDKLSREAKKVSKEAAQIGAALTGLGGLLVREASKYDTRVAGAVKNMQGAYAGLAVELGRALVPAVNRVADFIDRLTAAWRSLSPEQRTAIVDAAELAVKLTLVVAVGAKLVSMGAGIASFALAFAPMLPLLAGIAIALGAVVTLVGAVAELSDGPLPGLGEGFQKVAQGVLDFAKSVPNFVKYVLAFTVDATQNMLNWLLEGFAGVLDALGMSGGVLRAVKLPTFSGLLDKNGGAASQAIEKSFFRGADIIGKALEKQFARISGLFGGGHGPRPVALDAKKKDEDELEAWARKVQQRELKLRNELADKVAAAAERERKARLALEEGIQKTAERFGGKLDEQAAASESEWDELGGDFFGRIGQWFAEATRQFDRLPLAKYVAGLGQSLLSKMGQTGVALGGAIQGGMTAGPWGAIAGAAAELLTQAKGFTDFMKVVNASTQELADALGSFLVPMQTFAGGMHYLGNVLNRVLTPVMEALGDVFGDIGGFLILMAEQVEPLVPVVQLVSELFKTGMKPALELLFWSMKPIVLAMLGGGKLIVEMAKALMHGIRIIALNLGMFAENIAAGLGKPMFDLAATIADKAISPLQVASDNLSAKFGEVEKMTLAEARAKAENAAQTAINTEKLKEMAEQLTNVPAGFKVAAARYGAQAAGVTDLGAANGFDLGGAGAGLSGTPQKSGGGSVGAITTPRPEAGAITINGDLVVQGDMDTLKRQLKQLAYFRTGTPVL